ncbi:hypothetical protein [Nocardia cyriacigeorgica]|uniref:hypothetical protein n=1 Tax=Nocardia cyriacigeorgica TaxID=135487 RepID=UPI0018949F89|nr:hypothetical protein [Nocardia cyriacigeorgica]MBF6289291.1 hypothetical protein [Nocardia cyriacigeorgica]
MSDTTIRDQLAAIIGARRWRTNEAGGQHAATADADAILAAGFRPPARVITDPAELPTGSIVVRDGVAWQLEKGGWSMRGTRARWDEPHGTGPIILLYVPAEEARDGE